MSTETRLDLPLLRTFEIRVVKSLHKEEMTFAVKLCNQLCEKFAANVFLNKT